MRHQIIAALSALLFVCAGNPVLRAQASYHHYVAIDMGTLGGPSSSGCVPDCRYLNNQSAVIFRSETANPDPFGSNPINVFDLGDLEYAVIWQNGSVIQLNPLVAGYSTFANWVSDSGIVAGLAENGQIDPLTTSPETVATIWYQGFAWTLGTLGGASSAAEGVNNVGQVVGAAATPVADPNAAGFNNYYSPWFSVATEQHAFLWQDGFLFDLGTLGGTDSVAVGINQSGQVAGYALLNTPVNSSTGIPTMHAFLWQNGTMSDLGSLGGTVSQAAFINDSGQVIGTATLAGDQTTHSFIWQNGTMTDLGTLGGDNATAIWINNAGQAVGYAQLAGDSSTHAFLWQNGTMTDLGTVGTDACSAAYSINSSGQVVGDSGSACGGHPFKRGFIWQPGGTMVDVSTLYTPLANGWTLGGICCINDRGEMLGTGTLPNGDDHVVFFIPCDSNHPNVTGCDYTTVTPPAVAQQ